jgi:hypothetical protein
MWVEEERKSIAAYPPGGAVTPFRVTLRRPLPCLLSPPHNEHHGRAAVLTRLRLGLAKTKCERASDPGPEQEQRGGFGNWADGGFLESNYLSPTCAAMDRGCASGWHGRAHLGSSHVLTTGIGSAAGRRGDTFFEEGCTMGHSRVPIDDHHGRWHMAEPFETATLCSGSEPLDGSDLVQTVGSR